MCNLKNLIWAPLRANRCREMPRGRRVIVCGARPQFGTDYVQNALYKTLDPTPFLASSAISERLGFGMRLARIPCSSARHPYSAMSHFYRCGTDWRGELPTVKDAPVPSSMAARSPSRDTSPVRRRGIPLLSR
jgi:hypothetical protein